jgi:hypothetical protein
MRAVPRVEPEFVRPQASELGPYDGRGDCEGASSRRTSCAVAAQGPAVYRVAASRLERLILCIDASLNCGDGDLPDAARVVRFKRHIDPVQVLTLLEA